MLVIKKDLLYMNVLGKHEPTIILEDTENSYHLTKCYKKFIVTKTGTGKWVIDRIDTYCQYRARIGDYFGYIIEEFDSMIQAVSYMIKNIYILH